MNTSRMSKRELILSAIEFNNPDRIPVSGSWCMSESAIVAVTGRTDYRQNPKEVFAEALRKWDIDLELQFVIPGRLDRQYGPKKEVEGTRLQTCVYSMIKDWEKEKGLFKSPEDVRDFCMNLPDSTQARNYVDKNFVRNKWIDVDLWGEFLSPTVWVSMLVGTCPWMWYEYFGYENYLMAHTLYAEEIERLFKFCGAEAHIVNQEIALAINERNMIPLVYSGEDICDNTGPLCSPVLLHDLYFPHLKRAVQPIIESGIHWLWHSDGNILPILDDLLDCGIDGFQGFEEDKGFELNELLKRKCKSGKMPFIMGSVSVTTTMYGSLQGIREEKKRMKNLSDKNGGGVILAASSSVMADTPVENIMELYSAL